MLINEFIQNYKNAKIQNSKVNPNAVSEYLRNKLDIKTYIPFRTKRKIVEMVVQQYTKEIDGVKKYDSISAYVGFVTAMISAHTILTFSSDPVADYDLLAENKLLSQIIAEFQESYNECDILLKMALESELEDNNIEVFVGRFLNEILKEIDDVGDVLKDKIKDLNLKDILGTQLNETNLAKLNGFLDKLK